MRNPCNKGTVGPTTESPRWNEPRWKVSILLHIAVSLAAGYRELQSVHKFCMNPYTWGLGWLSIGRKRGRSLWLKMHVQMQKKIFKSLHVGQSPPVKACLLYSVCGDRYRAFGPHVIQYVDASLLAALLVLFYFIWEGQAWPTWPALAPYDMKTPRSAFRSQLRSHGDLASAQVLHATAYLDQ